MKRYIFTFVLAATVAVTASAQSRFDFGYSIGLPMGDLNDFISKPSFRGITMDYRYMVQPNIAVGANIGWNVFYEAKSSSTYTVDNASLSGKQYRYSNNAPMLVTATYYLNPDDNITPFFGLGIGTMYTRRNTDMNLYTLEEEAWHFALQPEAGVNIKFEDHVGVVLSLKYINGSKAGDFDAAQSYLAFNVGFSFF